MRNPEDDRKQGRRPKTRTMEPPTPERGEQVPPGDDSDINPGEAPPQRAKSDDETRTKKKQEPIETEPQGGEDGGCAC
jgi:hypothetical protein